LLFVNQKFHNGNPRGVVDGEVNPVVADDSRAPLLMNYVIRSPLLVEASQLLNVDVNQVSRRLSLVPRQR